MIDGEDPQTLRELVAELKAAHRRDPLPVLVPADTDRHDESRWERDFRAYVVRDAWKRAADGTLITPLRASIAAMANGSSDVEYLAGVFAFLMCSRRFHVRHSWHDLVGPLARQQAISAAEPWARYALRRWWLAYRRGMENQS